MLEDTLSKPRKVIITFISFWILVIAGLYWLSIIKNDQVIFFYSENCPHCKLVEQFMQDNHVIDKYPMIMKEIINNEMNRKDLFKKARVCGLNNKKLGVPLLFDKKDCYVGDKNIINYLQQRINK